MFSWPCFPLAVVGGLHNYRACKVPSHVSFGQSRQTWRCVSDGSHWEEGSNCFPGSRGRKCQKARHHKKRLINILCFLHLSKLAFGECSEVFWVPEAKTHVRMVRPGRQESPFWQGWYHPGRASCSPWHSNVQSQGLLQNISVEHHGALPMKSQKGYKAMLISPRRTAAGLWKHGDCYGGRVVVITNLRGTLAKCHQPFTAEC